MYRVLWKYFLVIPTIFNGFLFFASLAYADIAPKTTPARQESVAESNLVQSNQAELPASVINLDTQAQESAEITGQVTSVSQLSDVRPTDWAFQALQSLVERYGAIAGYPDATFKGNRALTRYEFAAGLNAALDRLSELIASNTADLVKKEDLATLQKLQAEFAPELQELRGKIENLEVRTAEVEANQFSTTTKLLGDAIFVVGDTFGDRANNTAASDTKDDTQTFFAYRSRLTFQTSFTGKDQLSTILSYNTIPNLTTSTGTAMTRFTFDSDGNTGVYLSQLVYRFPLGKNATVWVGPRALQPALYAPTLNASIGGLNGALSRFATFNPTVYRPGFDGAGAALGYKFSNQLQLSLGYTANNNQANLPDEDNGFFNANSIAFAQVTLSPSRQLDVGLTYARKYFGGGTNFNLTGGTGSTFARNPFQQNATTTDNFGLQFNWRASQRFVLGGWFGYTLAHQEGGPDNDATIVNGALTLAFPDLFKEGNVGGFIVGVPPKVTSNDYRPTPAAARREDPDTALHLEAFYTFRVNDNIRVTPTCYFITNPEHNDANDPIWVGAIRTSFSF
ncbi:carbohydrate porin [Nostoc sp. FACHB-152]|uniref:iron uptake porin n=1 Tax=unclassified Nostoc TaxID=2593658 RepID=UPI001684825E|nr:MULTISPECIES: iron uptake porin [unclassified Nostoc]MBD2445938.1 carbohydrate porin [Nostoc sp. FACHB-152]MBD2467886.1 carbohydrate porin [Nostoc sp. FACHB-145]